MTAGQITQGRRVYGRELHEYEPGDYGLWGDLWLCRAPGDAGDPAHAFRVQEDPNGWWVIQQRYSDSLAHGPFNTRQEAADEFTRRTERPRFTGNLSSHDVVEHDDGSITVSPSILISARWAGVEYAWHGYLERGSWREV